MDLSPSELEVLKLLASIKHDPVCPNCGQRYVDPRSAHGWCVNCDARRERSLLAKRRWWEKNRGAESKRDDVAERG